MPDNNQITQHGDTHPDVRLFTQGLRALPTDTITRVNHFITEYLGTPGHPVPFGGRTTELTQLTTWLTGPHTAAYFLLLAPAGRGKSALLVRWCQQLLTEQRIAVAYFPISIRFRTNLAGVALPALVALLANLHHQPLPSDPNVPEEVWRRLLLDYLSRPLPANRSLLLVLDGVDEAADWTPGPDIFPTHPPAGLHILLAARSLANDPGNDAWLQRLNRDNAGLAQTLDLAPLDRAGISHVLLHMGVPVSLLGTRVNIISELYRLSEGDPLLVRLYVDDLWHQGNAVIRFQPEDLHALHPGLAGYFERWWNDQRHLWEQEASERESITRKILSLLAGALGPLSRDDILHLLADEDMLTPDNLAAHIQPLARFVSGDGTHQGYVFSHPRLGNYFLEEHLTSTERQDIEQRFLTWGQTTLTALRQHKLTPTRASSYIIQYYGAHLERSGAHAHTLLELVSNGWRLAWEKLDRASAGFLGDVERAWKATQHEDQATIAMGATAPLLGEELRCLLSQTSINSVTSNISPRLMLEAVKADIWTPAQGLACIRLITDLAPRARELAGLAPFVQEPLRSDILQEALETAFSIKDEYTRLNTIIELAPTLPETQLWQILDTIPDIDDEANRAGILSELATALAPYSDLLAKALDCAEAIEDEEYQALALEGLAPFLNETQTAQALGTAKNIRAERFRSLVLAALIPLLTTTQLQDVLQDVQNMVNTLSRIRLLAQLVSYLPAPPQETTLREVQDEEIDDPDYRVEILLKLAPHLTESWLHTTLDEIQKLWDDYSRASALHDLLPFINTEELWKTFLKTALNLKNEEYRTRVLRQCIPLLATDDLQEILEACKDIWDEGWRSDLLARIKLYAPETLLPALLESITHIQDPGYRVWLLAEPGNPVVEHQAKAQFHIPDIFETIPDKDERLQTLLAIAPRLTSEDIFHTMLPEIFDFSWRIKNDEQRTHILCKLALQLPEGWLPLALETVQAMNNELYQVQILVALAPRLHTNLLTHALGIVRGMNDQDKRAQVLEALVTQLPPEQKRERIQEMLQVLQIVKDEDERSRLIVAAALYLSGKLSEMDAEIIMQALQALQYPNNQAQMLVNLLPHLPEQWLEWTLNNAHKYHQDDQTKILSALAPYVPARIFQLYLKKIAQLPEYWRRSVNTNILPYIPANIIEDMYQTVRSHDTSQELREAYLEILVALVNPESFQELWELARTVENEGKRTRMIKTLTTALPKDFLPTLWEEIQTISDINWRLWILKAVITDASDEMLKEMWKLILSLQALDKEMYKRTVLLLSSHIPAELFSEVWEHIQYIQKTSAQETISWQVLSNIIDQVPRDSISKILKTIQNHPYDREHISRLNRLLPRLSEEEIAELWQDLLDKKSDVQLHIATITTIAPYTPAHSFTKIRNILRTTYPPDIWLHVLKAFLPHLTADEMQMQLDDVYTDPSDETRIAMLDTLTPYLTDEIRAGMIHTLLPGLLDHPQQKPWQARILATLTPYLSGEQQEISTSSLLVTLPTLHNEDAQNWILRHLIINPAASLLPDILSALQTIASVHQREALLHILLQDLAEDKWEIVLQTMIHRLQENGELSFTTEVLKAAHSAIEQSEPSLLYPLIQEMQHKLATRTRREALTTLEALLPAIMVSGGKHAITDMCRAIMETGRWWE